MRRLRGGSRPQASDDCAPAVRYVYDRPLPYARIMRIEVLGPDGSVISATTRSYHPRRGWVTESVADCA